MLGTTQAELQRPETPRGRVPHLREEAALIASLPPHPNVAGVLALEEVSLPDGKAQLWMVMEYYATSLAAMASAQRDAGAPFAWRDPDAQSTAPPAVPPAAVPNMEAPNDDAPSADETRSGASA